MRQNATDFQKIFEWTGSRASPFDHPSITRQSHPNCGRVTRNAPTKPQYLSWLRKSPACCHYPSFPRRRESIPRLQSCNDTETNAIFVPGCEGGNSHEIFRTQRSEVRNLKSSPSKTPRVAGSALPRRHNFLDVSLRSLRPLRLLNGIQKAGMTGMVVLHRYESKSPNPYRLAKACSFSHVDSSTSIPCSSPLCVRRCSISPG